MAELTSSKIMFEIYQEEGYNRRYRAVFFTELNDHNKETEINRALAGRHFHDGFIRELRKDEAKAIIEEFVRRLNEGEPVTSADLEKALGEHAP